MVVMQDSRMELVYGDAHEWLLKTKEKFDLIIMDISDPIEAGPGICLYTKEFYEYAKTKLTQGGVFVTQAGTADSVLLKNRHDETCWGPIYHTLNSVFSNVIPYKTQIFSFGCEWGFVMAFNGREDEIYESSLNSEQIDDLIDRYVLGGSKSLQFYDGETHRGMMVLSKLARSVLKKEERIMTRDNMFYMY